MRCPWSRSATTTDAVGGGTARGAPGARGAPRDRRRRPVGDRDRSVRLGLGHADLPLPSPPGRRAAGRSCGPPVASCRPCRSWPPAATDLERAGGAPSRPRRARRPWRDPRDDEPDPLPHLLAGVDAAQAGAGGRATAIDGEIWAARHRRLRHRRGARRDLLSDGTAVRRQLPGPGDDLRRLQPGASVTSRHPTSTHTAAMSRRSRTAATASRPRSPDGRRDHRADRRRAAPRAVRVSRAPGHAAIDGRGPRRIALRGVWPSVARTCPALLASARPLHHAGGRRRDGAQGRRGGTAPVGRMLERLGLTQERPGGRLERRRASSPPAWPRACRAPW